MRFPQIITSLLENDLYKFSMGQAIHHQFPGYKTTWAFKCRNKDVRFTTEMVNEIKEQVYAYCQLKFMDDELDYLDAIPWINSSYIDFLNIWQPRYEDIKITTDGPKGLSIRPKGTWGNTSMYEIPILAIVNEVYFRMKYDYDQLLEQFMKNTDYKYDMLRDGKWYVGTFSEFGLRRRLSKDAQEYVIGKFSHLNDTKHCASRFIGTSNVYEARKHNVKPTGTQAHEWTMCVGQGDHRNNPAYSNYFAMKAWVKEYRTENGIALTDAITTDCFLRDYDKAFAKLHNGVRHDSGDPYEWGHKMIDHFRKLGIDLNTQTLLFSDSLDFERADKLFRHFHDDINVAFGIGTYLSNDAGVEPLNIVMKPVKCNGQDVAKISDTQGKGMCENPEYVDYLKRSIDWRLAHEKLIC